MKYTRIILAALAAVTLFACQLQEDVIFGVELGTEDGILTFGPEGGVKKITVNSQDEWVVVTEQPWITVSPANGRGSFECEVSIDSTLLNGQREGAIRIQNQKTDEKAKFEVVQGGFANQISVSKKSVEIEDFAPYGSRSFNVEVMANVDFDVVLPEGTENWLSYKKSELVLDKGARPRKVNVTFDWKVNSIDKPREADVLFAPVDETVQDAQDKINVSQKASIEIPAGTAKGDSLAVISISRALGMFTEFDYAEKMEHWNNVQVYKDGDNKGRIRYVQFFMFNTLEEIPYAVQFLDAAEEIVFYSNANQFLKSLDTGEWITKLTNLKRLTIGAYGLTSLHPDFKNLTSLEYLDLSSNCFQNIPEILTPENFPNLRALVMNANQRNTIYDLSNDSRENIGGFIEDTNLRRFKDILKWNKLDTLRLSVNYLQGEIPDMKSEGLPVWTFEELKDSLATGMTQLPKPMQNLPKVLPTTKFFAINFNRFTGNVPDWILYHPNLDMWVPYSLIFSQEGKTRGGQKAGFENEPASLDYYYDIYYNKKYNPNKK